MKHTFLAKAQWRATAKTFLVQAKDEEDALNRAERSREAIGAWDVIVLKQVPSKEPE